MTISGPTVSGAAPSTTTSTRTDLAPPEAKVKLIEPQLPQRPLHGCTAAMPSQPLSPKFHVAESISPVTPSRLKVTLWPISGLAGDQVKPSALAVTLLDEVSLKKTVSPTKISSALISKDALGLPSARQHCPWACTVGPFRSGAVRPPGPS